jgi:hypothetical protein
MNRTIDVHLNKVSPTPPSLRAHPHLDAPAPAIEINLGQLFLHKYFDGFPSGAPDPDPSSFEYSQYVSAADDFRFHAYIAQASLVKRREISLNMGQAFCRLMLADHFGIIHFAHMSDVLGKSAHAAFGGMRVERVCPGDVPDYLCGDDGAAFLAEAKGRFSPIKFGSAVFDDWRKQFTRVRVVDSQDVPRSTKGYIVATKLVTDASPPAQRAATFVEDPETAGEPLGREQSLQLARGTRAIHYSSILRKLELTPLASALSLGYALTRQLTFQVPIWTCTAPPFEGRTYIGGFYRTRAGHGPVLTDKGWQFSLELGTGHAVFVGLRTEIAAQVSAAARGEWAALDEIRPVGLEQLDGNWSSEFAWLPDGSVAAPVLNFLPTGGMAL